MITLVVVATIDIHGVHIVTVITCLAVNITARPSLAAAILLVRVVSVGTLIDSVLNHYKPTDLNNG